MTEDILSSLDKSKLVDAVVSATTEELTKALNSQIAKSNQETSQPEASTDIKTPIEEKKFSPTFHDTLTDMFALMSTKNAEPEVGTDNLLVKLEDVSLHIKAGHSSGLEERKLLDYGVQLFTQSNSIGRKVSSYEVSFSLADYAELCGIDITFNGDESSKEIKKKNEAVKNFRKKIDTALESLFVSRLTWEKYSEDGSRSYHDFWILADKGRDAVKGGNDIVHMEIGRKLADHLVQCPPTLYPLALFKIDARQSNAYRLGRNLAEHYSMYSNIKSGTYNRIKVKTALKWLELKSYKDLKSSRHGWQDRLKEPLEANLGILKNKCFLSTWEYVGKNGVELSDEEATTTDYNQWLELNIHFELVDYPMADQKVRIDNKKEKDDKKQKDKEKFVLRRERERAKGARQAELEYAEKKEKINAKEDVDAE